MTDTELDTEGDAEPPATTDTKSKWDPHLSPFNPHQDIVPPGYDEAESPFHPANVDALRKGFASSPDEPYIYGAMLAGQHFGRRLGLKGLAFSREHYEATFWGPDGHPSKKSHE